MHDACIIGHVTRDVVRLGTGARSEQPGGVAHYAAMALAGLGLGTAVLTKLARRDEELLVPLRDAGVTIVQRPSPATTTFENDYSGPDMTERRQRVTAVAAPFEVGDVVDLEARMVHLGPLTQGDMWLHVIEAVAARARRLSLDVQGVVRQVVDGRVRPVDWPEKRHALAYMDMVKADLREAEVLTGEADPERAARALAAWGPSEVIVTRGREGAVICHEGEMICVPALAPRALVDPTGCGDSFMAGYLLQRLRGDDVRAAGRFAAALATLKLERHGPFTGGEAEVRARAGLPHAG